MEQTGVVVDSKSDQAKNFYLKYCFTAFARKETSLFKPMQDIGQMFESGDTAPAAANDETHFDR